MENTETELKCEVVTHGTLVAGVKSGKLVYFRTFDHDDKEQRFLMLKAYDFVSENCDIYFMSSRIETMQKVFNEL